VGAQIAGVLPNGGLSATEQFTKPRKAYVLFNAEAEFDSYNGQAAVAALKQAATVIAFSAFKGEGLFDYADVLLPIAPFTETAGSFVNMEGKLQAFNGVVRPLGETRPGWKVLRVLGNLLDLPGFEQNSIEEVRAEFLAQAGDIVTRLNNGVSNVVVNTAVRSEGLVRVGEVPMFHVDGITRRAESLQATSHAAAPVATAHPSVLAQAGVEAGSEAVVRQGSAEIRVKVEADAALPEGVLRLAVSHPVTMSLGGMFDTIELKRG
jgi:NADH-quinone oxidoreductase subunit G